MEALGTGVWENTDDDRGLKNLLASSIRLVQYSLVCQVLSCLSLEWGDAS